MSYEYEPHKSVFARLLASENIRVSHAKVETANFDVKNRILTLPIWKDVSADIYDLLLAHEVGHALFSPLDGSLEAQKKYGAEFFTNYLNPMEDVRIEKLMKRKYGGLRRQFSVGYRELWDKDFFGVKKYQNETGKTINQMSVLDKLHINGKVGALSGVQFTAKDEQTLFAQAEAMETFKDAVALAVALFKHNEEQQKQQQQQKEKEEQQKQGGGANQQQQQQSGGGQGQQSDQQQSGGGGKSQADGSGEEKKEEKQDGQGSGSQGDKKEDKKEEQQSGSGKQGDKKEEESKSNSGAGGKGEEEEGEEEESQGGAGGEDEADGSGEDSGGESETDNISSGEGGGHRSDIGARDTSVRSVSTLQDAIGDLVDGNAVATKTVLFPELKPVFEPSRGKRSSSGNVVIDIKTVMEEVTDHYVKSPEGASPKQYAEFKNSARKVVDLMAKEFDIKKRADEYRRTTSARTGVLDMTSLHKYKISEDIFRRSSNVRDGKNHGFVAILDWSGSMSNMILPTTEQLLVMARFFKKVNVPFEIYLFSDGYHKGGHLEEKTKIPATPAVDYATFHSSFCLLNVSSSRLNMKEFEKSCENLYNMAQANAGHAGRNKELNYNSNKLATTPYGYQLSGTPLNESIVALEQVVKKFRTDTGVQVMNTIILTDGDGGDISTTQGSDNKVLIHMEGNTSFGKLGTASALRWLKHRTGSNIIGFYLIPKSRTDQRYAPRNDDAALAKWTEALRENDFAIGKVGGYDEHYTIRTNNVNFEEDFEVDAGKGLTDKRVGAQFVSHMNDRKKSRILAERFVKRIVEPS